jgi:hypothetical protein
MPATPRPANRRLFLLSVAFLLLSTIACATFRAPGTPAPTRPVGTMTETVTPTGTPTLTDTPAPTPSPTLTEVVPVTPIPTITPAEATPARTPSPQATSSNSS